MRSRFRGTLDRLCCPDEANDLGMTLIELMFAMVIFAIVAAGTVVGLTGALTTTRNDRNRVAASDLAARELEIVRNSFTASSTGPATLAATLHVVNPDPLPSQTAGNPLVVDNTPYTVTRDVEWLPAGVGKSACDGGAGVTYPSLGVTVTVTWPSMGIIKPVSSSTVLTPSKNTLNSNLGYVAVRVQTSAVGSPPASNQTVTMTGPGGTYSDVTATDGCAVFATATAGTYTVAVNQTGYVSDAGVAAPTQTVPVTAGTLQQRTFNYDQAASLKVTMITTGGYNLPTTLPQITLGNVTYLQPLGVKAWASTGVTTQLGSLWPASDGYTAWAGACTQADPAASGGTRAAATIVGPGATGSVNVSLAPITITVNKGILPLLNATVTATPVNTSTCASTENPLTLGVTGSGGVLKTSLPAGAWTIKVSGVSVSGTWPTTPVLLPTSSPSAITVTTL